MNNADLKTKLRNIINELNNPINENAIKKYYKSDFNYEALKKSIQGYIQKFDLLEDADDDLYSDILKYSKQLDKILTDGISSFNIKDLNFRT